MSVTRAVRRGITRLREHHPSLAEHLDRFIRTGTYCAYMPDPRIRSIWLVWPGGGRAPRPPGAHGRWPV